MARNTTKWAVAFDIGMLSREHTFDELVQHIREAGRGTNRGGPVAQRPRHLFGSITGDTTFSHGGAPGPSLLLLSGSGTPGSRMTWTYHPGAFLYRGQPLDPRGIWAVICYRIVGSSGWEEAGLLGPVKVGKR